MTRLDLGVVLVTLIFTLTWGVALACVLVLIVEDNRKEEPSCGRRW